MAALAILFVMSQPAVTRRIYASDEIEYFAFLRSLWFDHDLSFDNEYRYFYDRGVSHAAGFHETFLERASDTGRRVNFGTIGCALLWSPFYAMADILAGLTGRYARDGFSPPYVAAVCYASAWYGFIAVVLSFLAALTVTGARTGGTSVELFAALAVWIGTPLLFYMYVAPPMSHATSAFTASAFVLVWLRVRARWSPAGSALLGGLAALMAMVREQDLLLIAGPILDFLVSLRARPRSGIGRAAVSMLAAALTFAVVFLPQAVAYRILNGHFGPSQFVARKMTWLAPHFAQVVASPEHGFFFWTPLAALSLAGLILLVLRDQRQIGACLLLMFALQVYIAGSVESWTVAGAFGQRRFVVLTPVLVIGLAALVREGVATAARLPILAACAVCIWWNIGLMAQFGTGLMDRQRLELGRIAYNNFIVVPRSLPRLTYRYLFERHTFYHAPGSTTRRQADTTSC